MPAAGEAPTSGRTFIGTSRPPPRRAIASPKGKLARFQHTSFINFLPGAGLLVSPVSARGCSLTSRGDLDEQLACGPSYDFRLPSSKLDDDRARHYRDRDRLCVVVKPITIVALGAPKRLKTD